MNCDKARQCILRLDLRNWPGLPTHCDWQDWTGPYPADWQQIYARPLGNTFRPAQQLNVKIEGFTNPHLYFVEGKAVLFEAMAGPILVAFDTLLQDLGAPAARLDWDFGTLPLPGGEYVYPDWGITLFLNTDRDRALHVALYQPCTLDDYLAYLRPNFVLKRLPYRR